jgi:hypothetical protein
MKRSGWRIAHGCIRPGEVILADGRTTTTFYCSGNGMYVESYITRSIYRILLYEQMEMD